MSSFGLLVSGEAPSIPLSGCSGVASFASIVVNLSVVSLNLEFLSSFMFVIVVFTVVNWALTVGNIISLDC